MRTYRRHAIVLIMVVAAILTPADVLSMMMAAFPLLLLYEFSIMMSAYTFKKVEKRKREEEDRKAAEEFEKARKAKEEARKAKREISFKTEETSSTPPSTATVFIII